MDSKAIVVTGMVYLLLLILFRKTGERHIRKKEKRRQIRRGLWILVLINTLSVVVFIWTGQERPVKDGKLDRNPKGDGSRNETVLVTVDGVCDKVPVRIRVDEQGYTRAEAKEILQRETEKLPGKIMGKNQEENRITSDMKLITSIPDYPISIQWYLDSYQYMSLDGSLKENIPKEGSKVFLKAELCFDLGEEEKEKTVWERTMTLYPPELDDPDQVIEALEAMVEEENKETRADTTLYLPQEIAGRKIRWERGTGVSGYQVLGTGAVIFAVLFIWKRQKEEENQKKRKELLLRDYPEILEQFSLLIGAGMTVKGAWNKIVENYQERQEVEEKHPAYEEMVRTCYEMQGGVPEGEGYENFGKRCQTQEYMRLGILLSQNLKKGTRGISELLSLESVHAFEDRKSRARRKGEETGTKLLVPMIMMLAVVLLIVIVPAFWSMTI